MATNRFFRKARIYDANGEGIDCLYPLDDDTKEWLGKKKLGHQFKANMKSTRNPDHHRKAFAMFKLIVENHPKYENVEDVLVEMKVRSGHYTEFIKSGSSKVAATMRKMLDGKLGSDFEVMRAMIDSLEHQAKMVYIPKSINFENMGQEEFEELYEKWIPIACDMIGVSNDEIRAELAKF